MKPLENEFSKVINSSLEPERDLPGSFPRRETKKNTFTVKYARFVIGDDGCPQLEAILNTCLTGKYILASEQMHFTKDGDAIVIIKYLIPASEKTDKTSSIQGRRRIKKMQENKQP